MQKRILRIFYFHIISLIFSVFKLWCPAHLFPNTPRTYPRLWYIIHGGPVLTPYSYQGTPTPSLHPVTGLLNSADHPQRTSFIHRLVNFSPSNLYGFHTMRIHSGISFIHEFIHHPSFNSTLLSYSESIPSTAVIHRLIHFYPWGRILGRIPDKSLKSFFFLLCTVIYTALPWDSFIFLQTHATSYVHIYTVQSLYTVKEKGGKPDRKPYPLPYGSRNPYRKSENSQDYAQKPLWNCMFINSASVLQALFWCSLFTQHFIYVKSHTEHSHQLTKI